MYIIKIVPNSDGTRPGIQTWEQEHPPTGYAEFPAECLDVFYQKNKDYTGFVTFEVENNTAINVEWDEEAYQEYVSNLPEPIPEPIPMTQAEMEEMLLDQEYRLLLLEYGLEDEEF